MKGVLLDYVSDSSVKRNKGALQHTCAGRQFCPVAALEALRGTAPGRIEGEKWQNVVSVMIAGTKKYGWVDEVNGSIKAHVAWAVTAI
jgi:hypothetical protein